VDHRILHALPPHNTPGECDIEGGIVAARERRANGKNPLTMTTTASALLRAETDYASVLDHNDYARG
jgi:hypothetical protein